MRRYILHFFLLCRDKYAESVRIKERKRLKNHDFTLITINCSGGKMYHNLGLRFDSPTINTSIPAPEFCEFCAHLKEYLNMELEFYNDPSVGFPVAKLGNIRIYFNHYLTAKEAEEKWNERKKRIHWDNLYIITSDRIGVTDADYRKLEKAHCKRKVIFTSRPRPDIVDSFYLKSLRHKKDAEEYQSATHFLTGLKPWERDFDYVAWLNDEEIEKKI